jgi:acyl-CoA thioester hydrolase
VADPSETRIEVEVRYAETDQMGVVHHAVYPVWFELARTRLCGDAGYPYAEIENLGYFLMVTGIAIEYRQPARYGERVIVGCRLLWMGSRGLRFGYRVERDSNQLARGTSDHIWIDIASNRPRRIPEVLRQSFARLHAP